MKTTYFESFYIDRGLLTSWIADVGSVVGKSGLNVGNVDRIFWKSPTMLKDINKLPRGGRLPISIQPYMSLN